MLITVEELDIDKYERDKQLPATIVRRQEGEFWAVRDRPLETDLFPRYLWTREEDHVRIPLYPYLSRGQTPAVAMGMAAKLGALVVEELYDWLGRIYVPRVVIARMHVVLGHPVQDDGTNLRFWCGFGFVIKERSHGHGSS